MVRAFLFLLPALALCGCAGDEPRQAQTDHDPAMSAALEGPLLTDPDLSHQNMRNAAVVPGGPADPAKPPPDGT